jgi:hemerythrin
LEKMVAHNPLEPGISRDFFNRVKQDYLTTTNVKKIDIGGGYIHGKAEDFREDASEKILLAHTAIPLTEKQKEIGSGSQFGTVDTLIPAHQDYIWSTAFQLLQTNFPTIPEWDVKMLLNNSPILFNPQSIILKKGVFNTEIFMILTGNVERIDCESGTYSLLSSGAFVGETTETIGAPLNATYRTVNFVNALKIPIHLYLEVIKKNNLLHDLEQLRDNREFLQTTWLFGEALSYPTLNRIAKSLHHEFYSPGHVFSQKEYASLHLITSGKIQRYIGEDIFETLVCGDTFGEEGALFQIPSVFQFRTNDHAEAYTISTDVLIDIPIVRWKLYEMFEKRIHSILDTKVANSPILYWRQEYSVHIHAMDKHHQTLFERANDFYMALDAQKDKSILESTLCFLLEYTTYHFTEEEMLMKNHGFPGYENHSKKHAAFKKDIDALCAKFQENDPETGLALLQLLKNWILDHILTEDRKYGEFLNKKGVH